MINLIAKILLYTINVVNYLSQISINVIMAGSYIYGIVKVIGYISGYSVVVITAILMQDYIRDTMPKSYFFPTPAQARDRQAQGRQAQAERTETGVYFLGNWENLGDGYGTRKIEGQDYLYFAICGCTGKQNRTNGAMIKIQVCPDHAGFNGHLQNINMYRKKTNIIRETELKRLTALSFL